MAAGFAAQCGETEYTAEDCRYTRHMFGRNVLQFVVATNLAMGIEEASKRHRASMKADSAGDAAPWQDAGETEKMVLQRPALGPAAVRDLANRTA